jgi:hypothetical protein
MSLAPCVGHWRTSEWQAPEIRRSVFESLPPVRFPRLPIPLSDETEEVTVSGPESQQRSDGIGKYICL